MNTSLKQFEILGLEPRDIRVYETIYKKGNASLRTIAADTGINRGTVHEIVKKLQNLGLLGFNQTSSRRTYIALSPNTLGTLLAEKKADLHTLESTLPYYVSQLKNSIDAQSDYFARFFEGFEGTAAILRDVIDHLIDTNTKEYYVFSSRQISSYLYRNFKTFTRKRVSSGISVKVLADDMGQEATLAERRLLPASSKKLSGYVIIYGYKIAMITLNDNYQLSGVVIKDKGIANMQRLIFESLWTDLKPKS